MQVLETLRPTFTEAQKGITFYNYMVHTEREASPVLCLWVSKYLLRLQSLYNVARPLTEEQLATMSELVCEHFTDLTLADLQVFVKSVVDGHIQGQDYPKMFDRIDWQWLRDTLRLYCDAKIAHREREAMAAKAKADATPWCPELAKLAVEKLGQITAKIAPKNTPKDLEAERIAKRKEVFTVALGMPRTRIEAWMGNETDLVVKQYLKEYLAEYGSEDSTLS